MVVSFTEMSKRRGEIPSVRNINIYILNFIEEKFFFFLFFHLKVSKESSGGGEGI